MVNGSGTEIEQDFFARWRRRDGNAGARAMLPLPRRKG